jgi:methionyl-tRNA formyltransferase
LRIIFFGTPVFAAFSLKILVENNFAPVCVITAPDKPAGRGQQLHMSDVKKEAIALNLPILQPVNLKDPAFLNELTQLKPDLGIVIAFRMLPESVWSLPHLGTFNLHASLLPQYRGAAPINHAIINGETETGVTTFFLKHAIDTGNIVLQETVNIDKTDNAGSLHDKLMIKGADLVLETVRLVESGKWPQKAQTATQTLKPAPKLNAEFCRLSAELSALEAHNKIRGLSPNPGAVLPDGSLKVFNSALMNEQKDNPGDYTPGKLRLDFIQKRLFWGCKNGELELLEVQAQGKKRMSVRDYLNGQKNILNQ